MNLQLFVKEKLITSVPVNSASISNPVYLSAIKKELQEKHKELIDGLKAEPIFNLVPGARYFSGKNRGLNLPLL